MNEDNVNARQQLRPYITCPLTRPRGTGYIPIPLNNKVSSLQRTRRACSR